MSLFGLEVWGDYACFTRPETKVERLSYPVITPSAARAIFDAIYIQFSKSQPPRGTFFWQISRIEILKPIVFISLTRNEVKGRASTRKVLQSISQPDALQPLLADATDDGSKETGRTQRQSMILREVRYRIFAEPIMFQPDAMIQKQIGHEFTRRAKKGKCFHQPYLGCREFTAFFEPIPIEFGVGAPINQEIGWMIYDTFDLSTANSISSRASISIFRASIQNGVLEVPAYQSDEVRKLGPGVL